MDGLLIWEQRVRPHGATSSEAEAGGDALRGGRRSWEARSGRNSRIEDRLGGSKHGNWDCEEEIGIRSGKKRESCRIKR